MTARSVAGSVALVGMGILVSILLLEAVLQLGALALGATGREAPRGWKTDELRILCLGDSNTYGLRLEREEAYPAQLEAVWNRAIEAPRSEVLNLGYPGMNSSRLLRDLPDVLEAFEPDLVLVMIGANDFWTEPVPTGPSPDFLSRARRFASLHSRIYRLVSVLRTRFVTGDVEFRATDSSPGTVRSTARYGGWEFDVGFVRAGPGRRGSLMELMENLRVLVAAARGRGATPVLVAYPAVSAPSARFYHRANQAIRGVARETDALLIDLSKAFALVCPQDVCPELLFPDHHPTARGYRLVAETIAPVLAQAVGGQPRARGTASERPR